MSVSTERLGTLLWALIFGGLIVVGVGIALERSGQTYGWMFLVGGAAAIAAGCVLLWVRSRMPET